MKKYLYLLIGILGYILLCSKSCAEPVKEDSVSSEEQLIHEKADIRNEFGAEYLSEKSLNAFEAKAKQELIDFSDYHNILSDNLMDDSFKEQSSLTILNSFISDTIRISNHLSNDADFRKVLIREYVRATALSDSKKIIFDSIKVAESLHFTSELRYEGRLTFVRSIKNLSSKDTAWSPPSPLQAGFYVTKIKKSFGEETLQIWNLSLGSIE